MKYRIIQKEGYRVWGEGGRRKGKDEEGKEGQIHGDGRTRYNRVY